MKYNTLYSRDSTGNIRIWYIEQEGDKYRTTSGIDNGGLVTSEWTTALPKNEGKKNATTGEEQATKEIESKYKKQLKTGYTENINQVDTCQEYFQVMLAKSYDDHKDKIDWSKGVVVQVKYNGARCVATKDGLFTRKGERYISVPHISKALEWAFKDTPDLVLDGELFNYDLRGELNELMSLVRKTKNATPEDIKRSAEIVKFYIYDAQSARLKSKNYNRRLITTDMVINSSRSEYLQPVQTWVVHSEKECDDLYASFVAEGHEGAMIRIIDAPSEHKRSKFLLKRKPEDDDEGVILKIIEGEGNWKGTAKTATIKWKDKEFDATFRGSHEQCIKILNSPKDWVGKEVTFLYNGLTGRGTPNFARIDVNNCFKR